MESLFSRVQELEVLELALPSGDVAHVRRLHVRFGHASPDRLPFGALQQTYTDKPLVTFRGAAMFGELVVLRWLEADGWEGVWADTFHGRKFWRAMPTLAAPIALPSSAKVLYDRIVAENNDKASGMFDVMAWRGGHTVFLDYQAPNEHVSKHRLAWIDSAIAAGVSQHDLFIVSAVE